jgi:hypothetical protein
LVGVPGAWLNALSGLDFARLSQEGKADTSLRIHLVLAGASRRERSERDGTVAVRASHFKLAEDRRNSVPAADDARERSGRAAVSRPRRPDASLARNGTV